MNFLTETSLEFLMDQKEPLGGIPSHLPGREWLLLFQESWKLKFPSKSVWECVCFESLATGSFWGNTILEHPDISWTNVSRRACFTVVFMFLPFFGSFFECQHGLPKKDSYQSQSYNMGNSKVCMFHSDICFMFGFLQFCYLHL